MPDESDPSFSPTRWRIDVETRLSRLEDAREPEKLDEILQLMNHPDDGVIVRLDRLQQIAIQNEKNEKARTERSSAMRIGMATAIVGSIVIGMFDTAIMLYTVYHVTH